MWLDSYLCLAGVEISNGYRVASYVENVGLSGVTMGVDCQCSQLDTGFTEPTGEAPWYLSERPESSDFLGFWMYGSELQSVMSRGVTQNGNRSSLLTPLITKGRILQGQGLMMARSPEGMEYGERWLSAALRGSPCSEDGCPTDDAVILPACPESAGYDESRYFRTLVDVGLVDGPIYTPVITNQCITQQASFVLTSAQPWIYHPATREIDEETLADYYASDTLSCALTVPQWMGDGTFRIELENTGATDAIDITIEGKISIEGNCPISGAAAHVPPSFRYVIPILKPEDRIIIDGARRKSDHYDASHKVASSALPLIDWDGPFVWPDVGPCTTMCVELTILGGEVSVTVDSYLREL